MGQKKIICSWCQAETNDWTCDHSGDCLCHVFGTKEKKYSCEKKDCKEKQRVWQESAKNSKNKEQEKSEKIQEQIENYQNLEKEINDIVADGFVYWEDNEIQNFFADWKQKITNESETWENISSEQSKSLKNSLSQKREEVNQAQKKHNKEEKILISWDNFLGIIEELKENPNAELSGLTGWEKLAVADKELAKVVQKIVKEGEKVKEELKKERKEKYRELEKNSFRKKVGGWLDIYQLNMKHKGISLQDKDLSVLDELAAEICDEQKSESPEPGKKTDPPTDKNDQPPPTQHDISKKYQNDAQKQEINNPTNWQNSQEQKLAEKFLKKLIEAELYLERKQSNPKLVSELLQLKKDYPNIYQLLNKEERVDKVITKLQELEKDQESNSQSNNKNPYLLPGLIIGGVVIFLIVLVLIIKSYSRRNNNFRS